MKTLSFKKLFSAFLTLVIIIGAVPFTAIPASAATTADGLVYEIANGSVTITDYTGSAAELVIPETIEGCPVTKIGSEAFRDCTSLASITLPDSVTSISDFAFYCCTGLVSINIPDSITGIGKGAFFYCTSLTDI